MTSTRTDVTLRKPPPLPLPTAPVSEVAFCHPYYDPPHDVLFRLPRLDHCSSSIKGIHYGTALAACQIVANNAFNGYLATDRAGKRRVNCTHDNLLTGARYWFFDTAPSIDPSSSTTYPTIPYPVVPSFQDWAFPHQRFNQRVEEEYEQDQEEQEEQADNSQRDHQSAVLRGCITNWHHPGHPVLGRCIITYASGVIHSAHLIPSADREWFERNAMSEYGTHRDIDQSANKVNLRNDIHAAFDNHWFAIVPKSGSYAIHVLSAIELSTREFAIQFHNLPVLQQLQQIPAADTPTIIPPEFLYARFARAILLLSKPFIAQSPASRRIARYVGTKMPPDDDLTPTAYGIKSEARRLLEDLQKTY
ncbi:hypothetical protein GQX73_g10262 [Xylaria multiplex]|uniref:HNH nuclease domain-containing protein n=1 Tax=Xylaria multiplex TaxID=323545 RepID=A0A7C8ILE3_9PEZI|nr:hypothetical protein GQX73_g10262 [Xylaria multiplex]